MQPRDYSTLQRIGMDVGREKKSKLVLSVGLLDGTEVACKTVTGRRHARTSEAYASGEDWSGKTARIPQRHVIM